jgi:hypothetical protein
MTLFGTLVIDVLGGNIMVSLPGSKYAVTYHEPRNSPQVLAKSLPTREDPHASMTQGEFLTLAWRVANDKAKAMGWIV